MAIRLFGLTKCSTCIKARTWLEQNQLAYQFQDYRDHPIDADTLKDWAQSLGGWEKLVNRASMTWRHLDECLKTPADEQAWLSLIAQYPALIRRPVTQYSDQTVTVGFNEKRFAEKLGVQ